MVNQHLFGGRYHNAKVFITGHTGFKGSWLAYWLQLMGARVYGFSKGMVSEPSHYRLLSFPHESFTGDICDYSSLEAALKKVSPEIVFHLAAQPLVRLSYAEPLETLAVNIMGTANLLQACRKVSTIKVVINVTSDKCYENREWVWGYRENDPMGGFDPYSVSKGCSELITSAFRNSYFNTGDPAHSPLLLASARAGNVIGGGDWASDRLIPDIMRAVASGKPVEIRYPGATRPWQHVLEPLSGYLLLGQKLLEGKPHVASAWNFGPSDEGSVAVSSVLKQLQIHWPEIKYITANEKQPHEAHLLKLDCSKAHIQLQWKPVWDNQTMFAKTCNWYKNYYQTQHINTLSDIESFCTDAKKQGIIWGQ